MGVGSGMKLGDSWGKGLVGISVVLRNIAVVVIIIIIIIIMIFIFIRVL